MNARAASRTGLPALRAMLQGGTWSDREELARILHMKAEACLRRFGYLHRGRSDFREDIPTDAILPLLRVEEGPTCLRLPVLIRELARFLDPRPFPAVRMRRAGKGSPPMPTDAAVSLLLAQDDERLLLALDDLLRHRVRQAQHHWWCRQNPRHSRWLRGLKRTQSGFPEIVRGKIGWHWVLYLRDTEPPAVRVESGEIRLALRDRVSRDTSGRVLGVVKAMLEAEGGRYVLLGEVISVIVELETAEYCQEVANRRASGMPSAFREADRVLQAIHEERLREILLMKCSDLVEEDRAKDLLLGRPLHGPEIEQILVRLVVDDLVPDSVPEAGTASLRGRLAESLPGHAGDVAFQALYERARYLRRRLARAVEELVG